MRLILEGMTGNTSATSAADIGEGSRQVRLMFACRLCPWSGLSSSSSELPRPAVAVDTSSGRKENAARAVASGGNQPANPTCCSAQFCAQGPLLLRSQSKLCSAHICLSWLGVMYCDRWTLNQGPRSLCMLCRKRLRHARHNCKLACITSTDNALNSSHCPSKYTAACYLLHP